MSRDLTSGDLVSATPHYNTDLTLPEPIDLIRLAPFDLANYYKYIARDGHKDASVFECSKVLWYATDMAVYLYHSLADAGRPFLASTATMLDAKEPERRVRIDLIFGEQNGYPSAKIVALNAALRTIKSYDRMLDARPMESVIRYVELQTNVLGGLRDMLAYGYNYAASQGLNIKPLSKLYLGTRGQDVPATFFADVFPNHPVLVRGLES